MSFKVWVGVSNNPHDWNLLANGYPIIWCIGPGGAIGDWVMMYLNPPRAPRSGIAYVYKVTSVRFSTFCANKGFDAADMSFLGELDYPITIQELKENMVLKKLPAVVAGFHGTVFPVESERQKDALVGLAMERSRGLRAVVERS